MRKRLALFTGLLGVLVVSIGFAVAGTGAYFSDQKDGSTTANAGHLKIGTPTDITATFNKLMPGQDVTTPGRITIDTDGPVDVYAKSSKIKPDNLDWDDMAQFDAGIGGVGVTSDQWVQVPGLQGVGSGTYPLSLYAHLNISADNHWQDASAQVIYTVEAVQAGRDPQ